MGRQTTITPIAPDRKRSHYHSLAETVFFLLPFAQATEQPIFHYPRRVYKSRLYTEIAARAVSDDQVATKTRVFGGNHGDLNTET